jgi:hypothetical protein
MLMQAENRGQRSDERLLAAIAVNDGAAFSDLYRRSEMVIRKRVSRGLGRIRRQAGSEASA